MSRRGTKRAALALALLVGVAVAILLGGVAHTVGDRMHADFWPPDNSRVGPNLVAAAVQAAVVGLVVAILYPPFRHFLEREMEHMHAKLDHQADLLHHIARTHPDVAAHPDTAKLLTARPARGRPQ